MTPLTSRDDILRAYPAARQGHESQRAMAAVLLDAAFDAVLHEMHRHDLFEACGLTFKGGTALRKFDIGHQGHLHDLHWTRLHR